MTGFSKPETLYREGGREMVSPQPVVVISSDFLHISFIFLEFLKRKSLYRKRE